MGENVGTGYDSVVEVMEGFYDAEADYWDYGANSSYGTNNTEHMTQVIN